MKTSFHITGQDKIMLSWENDILGTLLRQKTGSLHDTVIVHLGLAMLLARGRTLGHQLRGIHLRLVRLGMGKSHPHTFNADQPHDSIKPRAGSDQPLHESKVATRHGPGRP